LRGGWALALAAGLLAGCLPRGRFHCRDDNQCTSDQGRGVCEAEGVCSFPDTRCPLGRRYARFAAGESSSDGGNCVQPRTCAGTPVVELRAGGGHACLRRLDNSVHCWGRNSEGQLGDGTRHPRSVPGPVAGLPAIRGLALGEAHTCALPEAGPVLCWGDNRRGQLGPGAATVPRPTPVMDVQGALELAAGRDFTCARTADGVRCWGDNSEGQLGVDVATVAASTAPLAVAGLTAVEQVVAGRAHACARLRDGLPDASGGPPPNVVCWGAGAQGQLGRGEGVVATAAPGPVAGLTEVVELSAGDNHTCARRRDGGVRCWGDNGVGQLGDGTSALRRAPVAAAFPGSALRVRAGGRHACAVDGQESLYCWGDNRWGQLGDGSTVALPAPVRVGGVTQVLELAAGGDLSCALTRSSALLCWGDDRQGQVGARGAAAVPAALAATEPPAVDRAVAVSAGEAHTCALRPSGEALCWGAGQNGRLGEGRTEDRAAPVVVRLPAGLVEVRAGGAHSCGRTVDRTVWCWGRGDVGQLGTGELGDRPQPVPVRGLTVADQVALGAAHACAISRGRVLCWGAGDRGQNGQMGTALEPAVLGAPDGVVEIAAGEAHTCARTAAGVVHCWGAGESGQLGVPAIAFRAAPAPIALPDGLTAQALALGRRHSCVLVTGGRVFCWGDGSEGQLGAGEAIKMTTAPVEVPGVAGARMLTAGASHTCVLDTDNRLLCWGAGDGGQTGADGEPARASFAPAPVAIGAATAVAAGGAHTCILDPAGGLRCFGLDDHGQLGRDRLLFASRPRSVVLSCP
jgi:alpha-tubulin suppressor-like RCC1 family protein